jgi:fido (protein-threonine AMPylation protein)
MADLGEPSSEEAAGWREWLAKPTPAEGRFDRAPRLTHPETVRAINEEAAAVLLDITAQRFEWETRLSPERLTRWHRTLFDPLFPSDDAVGHVRREWQEATYSVSVYDDRARAVRRVPARGAAGAEVHSQLEAAFAAFYEQEPAARRSLSASSLAAVGLSTAVYRTHPFLDGNTRTTLLLLQAGLHRLGHEPVTVLAQDWEWAAARSWALRPDNRRTTGPLVALVARRIS